MNLIKVNPRNYFGGGGGAPPTTEASSNDTMSLTCPSWQWIISEKFSFIIKYLWKITFLNWIYMHSIKEQLGRKTVLQDISIEHI